MNEACIVRVAFSGDTTHHAPRTEKKKMAGYSKTPLIKKLGIKPGFRLIILNAPENYTQTLGELPEDIMVADSLAGSLDFIHFFTTRRETLAAEFPQLKQALTPSGILWISWPKRSARVETDLTEDTIRAIGLENGLVDVKVAAVDEVWSGLKFVYRLKDR
jgi:hypothetical protein